MHDDEDDRRREETRVAEAASRRRAMRKQSEADAAQFERDFASPSVWFHKHEYEPRPKEFDKTTARVR